MDIFNPHSKPDHVGTEIVAKKKHEYKFIGSSIKRPGQKMWALDAETLKVYPIKMVKQDLISLKGRKFGKYRAITKASDPMLWALNKENAVRKFIAAAHESKKKLIKKANE